MTLSPDGSAYLLVTTYSSIDGIECITAEDPHEEPLQVADKSADWPNDSDQGPSMSVDRATIPSRHDQGPPQFSITRLEVVAQREPGMTPVFSLLVHCFYSLHEHIRERAPPGVA